ncbi:MAG: hypothetical protein WC748_03260 [Legionellales bacterium]|jgi:hypothetical protein
MNKMVIFIFITGLFLGWLTPYALKAISADSVVGQRELEMKINFVPKDLHHPQGELMIWKTIIPVAQENIPGIALHRHTDARIIIPLTAGILQRREPNGVTKDYPLTIGQPIFLPEDTIDGYHTDENLSDEPIKVMVLQFKNLTGFTVEELTEKDVQTVLIKSE